MEENVSIPESIEDAAPAANYKVCASIQKPHKSQIGPEQHGSSFGKDERDSDHRQDSFGSETLVMVDILDTINDGDSFFHAVFGENKSGIFETEKAREMREEWHRFLNQFPSLHDEQMPPSLRKQLKKILKEAISNVVQESTSEQNETKTSPQQLWDGTDAKKLESRNSKHLAEVASKYFLKFDKGTYEESDTEAFEKFLHDSENFYKIYLDSIKGTDHCVSLEEIPILASIADIKIDVFYSGKNRYCTVEPNEEVIGVYERNSVLWNEKKKETIHYGRDHFSRATLKSIVNSAQLDEFAYSTSLESLVSILDTDSCRDKGHQKQHSASDGIQYSGASHFYQRDLDRDNNMSGFGKLCSRDGKQFVVGHWEGNNLVEVHSIQFAYQGSTRPKITITMSGKYGIMTSDEDRFLARVALNNIEGLDFTQSFAEIRRNIFERLEIVKVIEDRKMDEFNTAFDRFIELLKARSREINNSVECAQDFLQLHKILEHYRRHLDSPGSLDSKNNSILNCVTNNRYVSAQLKVEINKLLNTGKAFHEENFSFPRICQTNTKDLFEVLGKIYEEGLEHHRMNLLGECTVTSTSDGPWTHIINSLSDEQVLCISTKDVKLFSDLEATVAQQEYPTEEGRPLYECLFKEFLGSLRQIFCTRLLQIRRHNSLFDHAPLTNPIYVYLYKSFQELIIEVCSSTNILPKDYLFISRRKWTLDAKCPPNVCCKIKVLDEQCSFIFKVMELFQPGNSFNDKGLQYKFALLKDFLSSAFESDKSEIRMESRSVDSEFFILEETEFPKERLIWLSIIDNAMVRIQHCHLKESKEDFKRISDPLLHGYKVFIQQETDSIELFRVTAHRIVKLATYMSLHIAENNVGSGIAHSMIESSALLISNSIIAKGEFFEYFACLVDVLNACWELDHSIVSEHCEHFFPATFKSDMKSISQDCLRIVSTVVTKADGRVDLMIEVIKSFREFVEELKHSKFKWYVMEDSNSSQLLGALQLVDNARVFKSVFKYCVTDTKSYVSVLNDKKCEIPPHYGIKVVQKLLAILNDALSKKEWSGENSIDHLTSLKMVTVLLPSMVSSLLYLKKQPDYRDFELFLEERTVPFMNVLSKSSSYPDFEKRMSVIERTFWYIQKQYDIGIKTALALLYKENTNIHNRHILESCFNVYWEQFTSFFDTYSREESTATIVASVQDLAKKANNLPIYEWTTEFKREIIPIILAGLALIWCVQESKNFSPSVESLKPNCFQILCILRLLSVDADSSGVAKHLSQMSAGQGKSLVIGLLSCLLALMGYRVRVVCYNKYLSSRDKKAFMELFEEFQVGDEVFYGTLEDMINDILLPEVVERKGDSRRLVEDLIRVVEPVEQSCETKDINFSNNILLIDEIDVLYPDNFPCNKPFRVGLSMLAEIQREIYRLIAEGCFNKESVIERIKQYTAELNEKSAKSLKGSRIYDFFREQYSNTNIKLRYSNQPWYNKHLNLMVAHAFEVHQKEGSNDSYRVNEEGIVVKRNANGLYESTDISGYRNAFNYLTLQMKDGAAYDHKNYRNYGYFIINRGEVACTKLLEEYPLILGVSGTSTLLNKEEQAMVTERYEINERSVMPAYFNSYLRFDKNKNFKILDTEETWLSEIFSIADSQTKCERAVLIFFETEVQVNKFRVKYNGLIARLNVLTVDMGSLAIERCVTEAGNPKTVTLVTRIVGRGLEIKPSLTVKIRGGLHVIQTFFSIDINEEIQIQSRTARRGNRGSYELILFRNCVKNEMSLKFPHRILNPSNSVTQQYMDVVWDYKYLRHKSEVQMHNKSKVAAKNIEESEKAHYETMRALKSLFY